MIPRACENPDNCKKITVFSSYTLTIDFLKIIQQKKPENEPMTPSIS